MLLGVIFVVHTSIGGDKLMFRYPAVTRGKVSDETMMAFRQQHPMMTPGSSGSKGAGSGGGGSNENDGLNQDQTSSAKSNITKDIYSIYNLSSEIITPILIPKPTLCDQAFELTIENTKFIGHPTVLDEDSEEEEDDSEDDSSDDHHKKHNGGGKHKSSRDGLKRSGNNRKSNQKKHGHHHHHHHHHHRKLNNSSNSNISDRENQSPSNCNDKLILNNSTNSTTSSSSSIHNNNINNNNNNNSNNNPSQQQQQQKKNNNSSDEITLFNIVFVLTSRSGDLNLKLDDSLKRLALKIASALQHEQDRCNYITKQAHEMMTIRDAWLTEHTLDTISADEKPNHEELTNRILRASRLAREIKDIYHGLKEDRVVSMRINGWVNLNLNIINPDYYPEYPIRPYHALLPFAATDDDSIPIPPSDISPALLRLLEVAKPTKNFRDLQMETDLPLAQIYRLASHLVYWRKAKIINMMTKNNVYVLNPRNSNDLVDLGNKFSTLFPEFKFQDILFRFSTARPLAEHISKIHQNYYVVFLQIVGWLLQHDLIVQLHTYVHLMIMTPLHLSHPNNNNGSVNSQNSSSGGNAGSFNNNNNSSSPQNHLYQSTPFPLMPSQSQPHEIAFFEKIDDNTKSYQLFKRLCPYFRGLHHLEEIMWRENISRDDLSKILKKYKSVLIQITHE
ncbi:UPF0171 family protein [Cavenderia fasciculata]|uniref:UPF0171 family protein n=1 Tax=Cavenderia fasciculata TaxID=261658 RepID=F4PQG8_CACFS|nr:UPF0171 family protein [Cavenderia fasciculata]EGG22631.1 UPF0171 family protein [Cavenderia fasciculata]|eukprot:XP_004360482.1 UPF0171 family protein [Cavenderia fasciculata]